VVKDNFTYSEVLELLEKLNGNKVENVKYWFDETLDDGLSNVEKISYICDNESKILEAIMKGHKACDNDEFQIARDKMKKYRKELGLI